MSNARAKKDKHLKDKQANLATVKATEDLLGKAQNDRT